LGFPSVPTEYGFVSSNPPDEEIEPGILFPGPRELSDRILDRPLFACTPDFVNISGEPFDEIGLLLDEGFVRRSLEQQESLLVGGFAFENEVEHLEVGSVGGSSAASEREPGCEDCKDGQDSHSVKF